MAVIAVGDFADLEVCHRTESSNSKDSTSLGFELSIVTSGYHQNVFIILTAGCCEAHQASVRGE